MKRLLYLFLFLFLLQDIEFSQINKFPTLWKGFISFGYGNTTQGNFNQYYDLINDSYNSAGVPIFKQAEFGKTFVLNGGFLFTRLESIWFGLSLGYLYSPAFANYKDFTGTLKVKGFVSSYEIALKVKAELFKIKDYSIFISVQTGIAYATATIIEELEYLNYHQFNYNRNFSKYSWGPSLQSTLSSPVQFGDFTFFLEVGYRYAYNKATGENLDKEIKRNFATLDWGQRGIIFLISLEKTF